MTREAIEMHQRFDAYCIKHITCDDCKYFKDKRITDSKSCNEVYAEDYYKRYGRK